MPIQLNHTIVHSRDSPVAATWFAELFGRPAPVRFGPFLVIEVDNGVSLDFMDTDDDIVPQHYAFLVSEDDFDAIFARIEERDIPYFADPDGHWMEIITRPYGSGG